MIYALLNKKNSHFDRLLEVAMTLNCEMFVIGVINIVLTSIDVSLNSLKNCKNLFNSISSRVFRSSSVLLKNIFCRKITIN